jgi:hypothetical protein
MGIEYSHSLRKIEYNGLIFKKLGDSESCYRRIETGNITDRKGCYFVSDKDYGQNILNIVEPYRKNEC